LVLTVGAFVGDGGDDIVGVTTDVAAGTERVRAASLGSPSGVRELLSETTTTLVEATGATTSTTGAPSTTIAPATTSTTQAAAGDDEAPASETTTTTEPAAESRALTTEPAPTTAAPTTTQAPRRTTTTAAPTTTTTAPEPEPAPAAEDTSEGGYAYDDPRSTQVWYDLAECESGGNWSIDTGNGYYGGLQFSLPTWESVGGSGYPHEHPAATQIEFGRTLQARQGWGAWPHCSEELGLR
jgi:hypothetical protein